MTKIYDLLWYLAAERQRIFFGKLDNSYQTKDPLLRDFKFTNAYRASDRTSQYLIQNVIYRGSQKPEELFFRIVLFKTFNHIPTWMHLEIALGHIPEWSSYTYVRYNEALTQVYQNGDALYSFAYMIPGKFRGYNLPHKYQNHLRILEKMMKDRLWEKIKRTENMEEVFKMLHAYPGMGPFLSYQFAIDLNYSTLTNFSENDFVWPGRGSVDGVVRCFGRKMSFREAAVMIRLTMMKQNEEFYKRHIDFKTLWGRQLQLIDVQNLFCEVGKYGRVMHPKIAGISGRKRMKRRYSPHPTPLRYWFPPKWHINERIPESMRASVRWP